MKCIGCLKVVCFLVILSCSHLVLAQYNWTGQAQCQVNFQIAGYAHQEIQTWTVTGPQLPNQKDVYPGTWSVTSQGATQRAVGLQNLAAQWNSNVAPMSAPLRIGVRPSDNRLLIKSFHAQMVSRAATQGVRQVASAGAASAKSSIASDAYEWQFPVIEDSGTATNVTGTGTIPIGWTYMPLAPSGSNGVANCTWHFTKGGESLAGGTGIAKERGAPTDRGSSAGHGGAAGASVAGGAAGGGAAGPAGAGASASAGGADASGKAGVGGGAASGGSAGAAGGAGAGSAASAGGAASGGKAGASGTASGGSAGAAGGAGAGASASAGGAASGGKAGAGGAASGGSAGAAGGAGAGASASAGGAASGGKAGAGGAASGAGTGASGAAGASAQGSSAAGGAGAQSGSGAAGAGVSTQSGASGGQVLSRGTGTLATTTAPTNTSAPTQATISKTTPQIASLPTPPTITLSSATGTCNFIDAEAIRGQSTHFVDGATTADFGAGITVLSTKVTQPGVLQTQFSIAATAAPGPRTVTVTTGSEVVKLVNGFTVTQPCAPVVSQIIRSGMIPSSIPQGTRNVTVNIGTVVANDFRGISAAALGLTQGVTRADFGEGITVVSLTVTSSGSATAVINVAPNAPTKDHTLTLTTGNYSATTTFNITVGGKPQITLNGLSVPCNTIVDFFINGVSTHFIQGSTRVDFGPKIQILGTTVLQPNNSIIHAQVFIANDAPAKHVVTVTTGSEVATVSDPLIVTQPCRTADSRTIPNGMTPNSIPQGTRNVTVNIGTVVTNEFREFSPADLGLIQGVTRADFGEGITVVSLTVTSSGSATAVINIAPNAPAKSHTLTLTTASHSATTSFDITGGGKPQITLNGSSVPCNMIVHFFINGASTHFIQGSTRVDFGPKIQVLKTTVLKPSNSGIDAQVFIAEDAPAKHTVTVTTGSEVATVSDPLIVTQPCQTTDSRTIPNGMTPSSIPQGTQNATVNIGTVVANELEYTLANLGLTQGVTRADFGPGITVVSLTVTSPGSATAVISIAPDAPAGARTVALTTASTSGTATFTVDRAQP